MINLLKPLVITIFSLIILVAAPSMAKAATSACTGSGCLFGPACQANPDSSVCNQANSQGTNNPVAGPGGIFNTAANVIAAVAGVIAIIMIIISGFMFVTAGGATPGQRSGDPNRIKAARSTLIGAIIGLIIIALAWSITRFIIDRVVQ